MDPTPVKVLFLIARAIVAASLARIAKQKVIK